ncbi:MAG: hypothetical protein AAGC79_17145 [Pseudomonadota bacterium]
MTEQNRRVDVRLGKLAISVQGFDDPVTPIQQIMQSVHQLLRAEPNATDLSIGLDDQVVQGLLQQLANDPEVQEDEVEAVPGLVIVRKAAEIEDADEAPQALPNTEPDAQIEEDAGAEHSVEVETAASAEADDEDSSDADAEEAEADLDAVSLEPVEEPVETSPETDPEPVTPSGPRIFGRYAVPIPASTPTETPLDPVSDQSVDQVETDVLSEPDLADLPAPAPEITPEDTDDGEPDAAVGEVEPEIPAEPMLEAAPTDSVAESTFQPGEQLDPAPDPASETEALPDPEPADEDEEQVPAEPEPNISAAPASQVEDEPEIEIAPDAAAVVDTAPEFETAAVPEPETFAEAAPESPIEAGLALEANQDADPDPVSGFDDQQAVPEELIPEAAPIDAIEAQPSLPTDMEPTAPIEDAVIGPASDTLPRAEAEAHLSPEPAEPEVEPVSEDISSDPVLPTNIFAPPPITEEPSDLGPDVDAQTPLDAAEPLLSEAEPDPSPEVEVAIEPEKEEPAPAAPINIFAPPASAIQTATPAPEPETVLASALEEADPEPVVEVMPTQELESDPAPTEAFTTEPEPVEASESIDTGPAPASPVSDPKPAMTADTALSAAPEAGFINIFAPPQPATSYAPAQEAPAAALAPEPEPLGELSAEVLAVRAQAESTADILSASAAWLALVKNQPAFTRREVMTVFEQVRGAHDRSLEARIKGYGRLVRNGQLVLVEDGLFGLSEAERERFSGLI